MVERSKGARAFQVEQGTIIFLEELRRCSSRTTIMMMWVSFFIVFILLIVVKIVFGEFKAVVDGLILLQVDFVHHFPVDIRDGVFQSEFHLV